MNEALLSRRPLLDRLRLLDGRGRAMWVLGLCLAYFAILIATASLMGETGLTTDFLHKKLAPCWQYPFGTDWLGRDMFVRTVKGLRRSLSIGLLAASFSSVVAAVLGTLSATMGRRTDAVVTTLIDLVMATPHLVLLILVSFACGGGATGIVIAVAVSHWTRLARIIRAEILQLKQAEFIQVSRRLGRSPWWIARRHMLPHIMPQFMIGLILLFPHAILHAAGLTFLGFGLSPHNPSIGILLAESMRHLSTGYWWLAILPGVSLLVTVKLFDVLGNRLRIITDPRTSQE
ncbi:ABC transporter permease [Pseudodesulfovibrio sp.]|uniref:ABC transporter permease n=1 Tax=unclassified Pseudodesulfovibrio TaxID=2661612 RepID=UPI003B00B432